MGVEVMKMSMKSQASTTAPATAPMRNRTMKCSTTLVKVTGTIQNVHLVKKLLPCRESISGEIHVCTVTHKCDHDGSSGKQYSYSAAYCFNI